MLSSPVLRCTETVRPYAELAEVRLEADPSLSADFSRTNGGNTPGRLIRDLVAARQSAIMCLHRETLPAVPAAACLAPGAVAPPDQALPKSGFWLLHAAGGNWPRPIATKSDSRSDSREVNVMGITFVVPYAGVGGMQTGGGRHAW